MIYLFESKLPENKSIYFGLTRIFGISKSSSFLICKKLGFLPNFKVKNLSTNQILEISKIIEAMSLLIANDLKRYHLLNKQRLLNIKSYKCCFLIGIKARDYTVKKLEKFKIYLWVNNFP